MSAATANAAAVLGPHLSEKRLDRLSRSYVRKRRFVSQPGISGVGKSNENGALGIRSGKGIITCRLYKLWPGFV
jgi:hypothetical protein